jgi:hypothetical protein
MERTSGCGFGLCIIANKMWVSRVLGMVGKEGWSGRFGEEGIISIS